MSMGLMFFNEQWRRLQNRFSDRAFDEEFKRLAFREVSPMGEQDFVQCVNTWIGERQHTKPPLITDFRLARISAEKRKLTSDAKEADKTLWGTNTTGIDPKTRGDVLEKYYGAGIRTPMQAFELQSMKLRIERAEAEAAAKPVDDGVLEF